MLRGSLFLLVSLQLLCGLASGLPTIEIESHGIFDHGEDWVEETAQLTIVILGATGDLAQRKLFPSLLQLLSTGSLPWDEVNIVGYARQSLDTAGFRQGLLDRGFLKTTEPALITRFIDRCHYVRGGTGVDDLAVLGTELQQLESGHQVSNRIFFLSLPPKLFGVAAEGLHRHCRSGAGWTRLIVEKPFGVDLPSAQQLLSLMSEFWEEQDIFRIDHYLGKQMVQNLLQLRSANSASLGALLHRTSVKQVTIGFSEQLGNEGRSYFDEVGIVRDVVQNHLLQMLAIFAMEPLSYPTSEAVRDAKVSVLEQTRLFDQPAASCCVFAQYDGYRLEQGVPDTSVTATFASLRLAIDNDRWQGVPFFITAGKAMDVARVHVEAELHTGERLTIEIQPNSSIALSLAAPTTSSSLLLHSGYPKDAFDPYAKLLLSVSRGDSSLFVRADELLLSWQIVSSVLQPSAELFPLDFYARGSSVEQILARR